MTTKTSRQIATISAGLCDGKKAEDIVVLDIKKITFITDYFVICTSRNERQSKAIADEIEYTLKKEGIRKFGVEGYNEAGWILQDFGDVIVHIFNPELRNFYQLEFIWADAKYIKWAEKIVQKAN